MWSRGRARPSASLRTIVSFENAEKLAIEYAERTAEAEEAKEAAARIRRREEEKQSEAAILPPADAAWSGRAPSAAVEGGGVKSNE